MSSEIESLSLDAGHFTAVRDGSAGMSTDGEITTSYVALPS